jgi:hypothetical protein
MDEFLKALTMLKPIEVEPLEYRLHYDSDGNITMCSMQAHPENTNYVVVDKKTYDTYYHYVIVDGKPKLIDRMPKYRVQLKKSNSGYQVVNNHAGLILEPGEAYADTEYYDRTN